MTDQQKNFIHEMVERVAQDLFERFEVGAKKYGNDIVDDYTVEEHIENERQELYDALTYNKATEILVARLKARLSELEDENARLREMMRNGTTTSEL